MEIRCQFIILGKSGVGSSFLPEKMHRHRITRFKPFVHLGVTPEEDVHGSGLLSLAERNKFATTAVGIKGRSRPTLQHARTCTLNSLLLAVGFGVG